MYLNKQLIKNAWLNTTQCWVDGFLNMFVYCHLNWKKSLAGLIWIDFDIDLWELKNFKWIILPLYPFWTIAFFPWLIIKSKQLWSLWNISPISGMDQWQRALDGDSHHGPLIELLPSWSLHLKRKHWTSINARVCLIRKSVLPGKQSGACK